MARRMPPAPPPQRAPALCCDAGIAPPDEGRRTAAAEDDVPPSGIKSRLPSVHQLAAPDRSHQPAAHEASLEEGRDVLVSAAFAAAAAAYAAADGCAAAELRSASPSVLSPRK